MSLIPLERAISEAKAFMERIFPNAQYIRVEEIERKNQDGQQIWNITIGFNDPDAQPSFGPVLIKNRDLRIFTVDAVSGEVLSMKIRKIDAE